MRVLQLHAEIFEYEPIAIEIEEKYADQDVSRDKIRLQDLVVTLMAIEEGDDLAIVKFVCKGHQAIYEKSQEQHAINLPLFSPELKPCITTTSLRDYENDERRNHERRYRSEEGAFWMDKIIFS